MTDLTRAHRIRIRIAVKGLKKKDVAEKVGVTASWLSRVLNERVTPESDVLERIERAVEGVNPCE